jgi:hypothetical protein
MVATYEIEPFAGLASRAIAVAKGRVQVFESLPESLRSLDSAGSDWGAVISKCHSHENFPWRESSEQNRRVGLREIG